MNPEQNLLDQCLSLGFDLPYFCWHPALGSVGACRQCAVKQFKDGNDKHGKIVMACMTAAADGTRISIEDPEAVAFRRAVIEGLMQNHPQDCPVCDEGGECHLQDMTVMTGHDYRRYRFDKRTFRNQYLGPFVNHEMNRCIQCYRCVRFYREYAGGADLEAFGLRELTWFGRQRDGVLENEFAGNLVEVCPTGVFTDRTLKSHYTRKWDLTFAPSLCVHCGIGCNISIGERYGMLRRVVNRYNGDVNGYFLCDRGRYGYEFVNSPKRIREPRLHGQPISPEAARQHLRDLVASSERVIGIGSPRASLESNFALRTLVGPENFYAGIPDSELRLLRLMLGILRTGEARTPSLAEVEGSDAVLILGEDVTNVAPRMALSLRQSVLRQPKELIAKRLKIELWDDHAVRNAAQDAKGPLFIASVAPTRLDDVATECRRGAPSDLARSGFAVAHALNPGAPEPPDLDEDMRAFSARVAEALKAAAQPLVICGASLRNPDLIRAAANVVWSLQGKAALSFIVPECNSFGLAMLAAEPLERALEAHAPAAIVLENDLYRRLPAPAIDAFMKNGPRLVVLDHLDNGATAAAELLLPAATFAEGDGTLLSNECRAQRFFKVFPPDAKIEESWRWLSDWPDLDRAVEAVSAAIPELRGIERAAPSARFRMAGEKIPREPHRASGRTAVLANITVQEPKPPADPDSPLSFSMEGNPDQPPAAVLPFFWSPGWNSIQSVNKFQEEIGGPLRGGNPGVRLFEARPDGAPFYTSIPEAFRPRDGQWMLVPLFHIFGSEELNREAPAVAELFPHPYIALNADDAAMFGPEVELLGRRLPVKIAREMPRGMAGLPAGLPALEGLELPQWSGISRVL